MTAAGNYDDSSMTISVDPMAVFADASVRIPQQAQAIAASITAIDSVWQHLRVGWVGTTADEAQDFNHRWVSAIQGLFGSQADPQSGALPAIAALVAIAAVNYGVAEDTIQKDFLTLVISLSASSASDDGSLQPPGRNQNSGAVSENSTP